MIEDLDGTMVEPARRVHVLVLSAATAALSLVLLVALVVPPARVGTPPLAASRATSAGPILTVVSNPIWWLRIDLATVCADGTRLIPPYHVAFDADAGRIFAGHFEGGTGVSVPVMYAFDAQAGVATVSCATSNILAPRVDLRSIAR